MLDLQQELNDWLLHLHPSSVYSKRNLFEQLIYKQQPLFATWHAMQHHCRLALHSSLVPQFSGTPPNGYSSEAVKMSAEASLRSAQSLSELGGDLVTFECNFGILPPYLGYCMYVAGSVHVTMVNSASFGNAAKHYLRLAMAVLSEMKSWWEILDRLVRLLSVFPQQC